MDYIHDDDCVPMYCIHIYALCTYLCVVVPIYDL